MNSNIAIKMIQRFSQKDEEISKGIIKNSDTSSIKDNNKIKK